jgi:hypothetical protein
MTTRTRVLIACTAAAIVQAAFLAGYYLLTDGCFCATLDSEQGGPHSTALASFLSGVDLIGALGVPGQVGDVPSAIERVVLNFLVWAMLLFIGLTGATYVTERLRRSQTSAPRSRG